MIYTVEGMKMLLKSLLKSPYMLFEEENERGEYEVITKKPSLWPFGSLIFIEAPY